MSESIAVAVRIRPQQLPDVSASASTLSPLPSRKTPSVSSSLPFAAAAALSSSSSSLSSSCTAAGTETSILTISETTDGKGAVVQVQPARAGAARTEFLVDLVFDSAIDKKEAAAAAEETPAAHAAGLQLQRPQLRSTTCAQSVKNEKTFVSAAPADLSVGSQVAAEKEKYKEFSSSPPAFSAERPETTTSAAAAELFPSSPSCSSPSVSSSAPAAACAPPAVAVLSAAPPAASPPGATVIAVAEGVSSPAAVSPGVVSSSFERSAAVSTAGTGDGTAPTSPRDAATAAVAATDERAEKQEHGREGEEDEEEEKRKKQKEEENGSFSRDRGDSRAATQEEETGGGGGGKGRQRETERREQAAAATTARWTGNSQANVFERTTRPLCDALLQGYNATVLAYGQTGSGKTYTVVGPSENPARSDDETRGLLPRALQYLFSRLPSKTKGERRRSEQQPCEPASTRASASAAGSAEGAVAGEGDTGGGERTAAAAGSSSTASDAVRSDGRDAAAAADGGETSVLSDVIDWSMELQFVEIYQEQIYDLLSFPSSGNSWGAAPGSAEDISSNSSSSSSAAATGVGAAAGSQPQNAGGSGSVTGTAAISLSSVFPSSSGVAAAASCRNATGTVYPFVTGRGGGGGGTAASSCGGVSGTGSAAAGAAASSGAAAAGASGAGVVSGAASGSTSAASSFSSLPPLFSGAGGGGAGGGGGGGAAAATVPLKIRYDSHRRAAYVAGARKVSVHDEVSAMHVFAQGLRNRRTAETRMNLSSSRSHAVFSIQLHLHKREAQERLLEPSAGAGPSHASQAAAAARIAGKKDGCRKKLVAQLHIVDLAGSERQRDTASGGDRLREAGKINYSLSVLSHVIRELAERSSSGGEQQQEQQQQQQQGSSGAAAAARGAGGGGGGGGGGRSHVPYRDSKLTFLLMDALGGSSKVSLIATVSSSSKWLSETISTLHFAALSKRVKNKAVANEERVWDKAYIESVLLSHREQTEELKRLRLLLQEKERAAASVDNSSSRESLLPPSPSSALPSAFPGSAATAAACASLWELALCTAAAGSGKDKEAALAAFTAEWKRRVLLLEEALAAAAHVLPGDTEQRNMQQQLDRLQQKMLLYNAQTGSVVENTDAAARSKQQQVDVFELQQTEKKTQQHQQQEDERGGGGGRPPTESVPVASTSSSPVPAVDISSSSTAAASAALPSPAAPAPPPPAAAWAAPAAAASPGATTCTAPLSGDPSSASFLRAAASAAAPSLLAAAPSAAAATAAYCAAVPSPVAAASAAGGESVPPQDLWLPRPSAGPWLPAHAVLSGKSSAAAAVPEESSNGEGLLHDSISTASELSLRARSDATPPAGRNRVPAVAAAERETAGDAAAVPASEDGCNDVLLSRKQQENQQQPEEGHRSETAGSGAASSSSDGSSSSSGSSSEDRSHFCGSPAVDPAQVIGGEGKEAEAEEEGRRRREAEAGGGRGEPVDAAGMSDSSSSSGGSRREGVSTSSSPLGASLGSSRENSSSSAGETLVRTVCAEDEEGRSRSSDKQETRGEQEGGGDERAATAAEPLAARRSLEADLPTDSCVRKETEVDKGPTHAKNPTHAANPLQQALALACENGSTGGASPQQPTEDVSRSSSSASLLLLEKYNSEVSLPRVASLSAAAASPAAPVGISAAGDVGRGEAAAATSKTRSPAAAAAAAVPAKKEADVGFVGAAVGEATAPAAATAVGERSAVLPTAPGGRRSTGRAAATSEDAAAAVAVERAAAARRTCAAAAAAESRAEAEAAAAAAAELASQAATRREEGGSLADGRESRRNGEGEFLLPSSASSPDRTSLRAPARFLSLQETEEADPEAANQGYRAAAVSRCCDASQLLPTQSRVDSPAAAKPASAAATASSAAATAAAGAAAAAATAAPVSARTGGEAAVAAAPAAETAAAAERRSRGSHRKAEAKGEEDRKGRRSVAERTEVDFLRKELEDSRRRVLMLEEQLEGLERLLQQQQQQQQRETCARAAEAREAAGRKKTDQVLPALDAEVERRFLAAGCFSIAAAAPFVLPITAIFDGTDTFRGIFLMLVHAGAPAAVRPTGYREISSSSKGGAGGATLSLLAVRQLAEQEKLRRGERRSCAAAAPAGEDAAAQGVAARADRWQQEGLSALCGISAGAAAAAPALLRYLPLMQVKKVSRVLEYSSRRRLHAAQAGGAPREQRQLQKEKQLDGGALPDQQAEQEKQEEEERLTAEASAWYSSFCDARVEGEHALSSSKYVYRIYFKHTVTVWSEEAAAVRRTKWVSAALEESALQHLGISSPEACDRLLLAVLKRSSEFSQQHPSTLAAKPNGEH